MFGTPGVAPPPPQALGHEGGGSATQAFSIPTQPQPQTPLRGSIPPRANVPPPASIPQGPSEYTRMISLGGAGTPAAPPSAPPPPSGGGGMPQFQMPQMQAPQMPQMPQMPPMPQVPQAPMMPQMQMQAPQFQAPPVQMQAPAKAPSSNMLMFAIIGVLIFIAGIVVTMLVLKK